MGFSREIEMIALAHALDLLTCPYVFDEDQACEMARACVGEDCRLPKNVQQLVRQGVTISFPENEDIVRRGYFGSMFLQTYNPRNLPGRPQVYDVDGPQFRRTGT